MANFQIDVIAMKGTSEEYITCPTVCSFLEHLAQKTIGTPSDEELVDPDTIVFSQDTITITFDYPLENPAKLTFTNTGGFSRYDFFRCVYEGYRNIYAQEEAADRDPGNIPGMLNRTRSHGPYGIWGHGMSDLFLEGIIDKGAGEYDLCIGS